MGSIDKQVQYDLPYETELVIKIICTEIQDMLIEKNRCYGDSAIHPTRIFSKVDAIEQINVRIDDKINRLMKGKEFPGDDTEKDLIGYLILKRVARRIKDELKAYQDASGVDCGIPEEQPTDRRQNNVLEEGFRKPDYLARRKERVCRCNERRTDMGTEDQEYLPSSQRTVLRHLDTGEGDKAR